jgi:hypothetical protein
MVAGAVALAASLTASSATAQNGDDTGYEDGDTTTSEPTDEAPPTPRHRKAMGQEKNKDRTKKNHKRQDRSSLFPDWSPDGFDWTVGPVLASQVATSERDDVKVQTTAFELGLRAGVTGVPLVPGNPGATVGVAATYAAGTFSERTTSDADPGGETYTTRSTRSLGEVTARVYAGCYRHTLALSRGRLEYAEKDDLQIPPVQSLAVTNDMGVLIIPWISEHLTWRNTRAFSTKFARPFLTEDDFWLHTRLQAEMLSLLFDIGPGFTLSTEYSAEDAEKEVLAKGRTDYVKLLSSANLFWKVGAALAAKYVYNSTEEELGELADRRLPDQELGQQNRLAPPEDSLLLSAFIGVRDVFAGLGLGYHYNMQVYHMGDEPDDAGEGGETKIVETGFGLSYEVSF